MAFWLYLNFDTRGGWWRLAGVAALFTLGMWCKSVVVTFPVALAIFLWYRDGRLARRHWTPLAILFGLALALALFDLSIVRTTDTVDFGRTPLEKVLLAARALVFYLQKLAWPAGLSIIYPAWPIEASNPLLYLYPLVAIALTVVLWAARDRIGRGPLACWLFYVVTLGPMLGLLDFAFLRIAQVADRFQYLASIGPCVVAGAGLHALWRRGGLRGPVVAAGCAVVLVTLGALSWRQATLYQDLRSLFAAAVERNPDSPYAHANLGTALSRDDKPDAAVEHFRIALEALPDYHLARSNLGRVLVDQGDLAGAVEQYRIVAEADPSWFAVVNDLAWYLAISDDPSIRDPVEALHWAEIAAEQTRRRDPAVLDTLAVALAANDRLDEARTTAAAALLLARAQNKAELAEQIETRLRGFAE